MELHLYYPNNEWHTTIHFIKTDLDAENLVRYSAERDDELHTWKLFGGSGLGERAVWVKKSAQDVMPTLIKCASDYSGRWQYRSKKPVESTSASDVISLAE